MFNKTLHDSAASIVINDKYESIMRFVADTEISADKLRKMQNMSNRISMNNQEYGIDMNVNKTKYMVVCKNLHCNA